MSLRVSPSHRGASPPSFAISRPPPPGAMMDSTVVPVRSKSSMVLWLKMMWYRLLSSPTIARNTRTHMPLGTAERWMRNPGPLGSRFFRMSTAVGPTGTRTCEGASVPCAALLNATGPPPASGAAAPPSATAGRPPALAPAARLALEAAAASFSAFPVSSLPREPRFRPGRKPRLVVCGGDGGDVETGIAAGMWGPLGAEGGDLLRRMVVTSTGTGVATG